MRVSFQALCNWRSRCQKLNMFGRLLNCGVYVDHLHYLMQLQVANLSTPGASLGDTATAQIWADRRDACCCWQATCDLNCVGFPLGITSFFLRAVLKRRLGGSAWESLTAAVPEILPKDRTTQRTFATQRAFAAALGMPIATFRNNPKRLGCVLRRVL